MRTFVFIAGAWTMVIVGALVLQVPGLAQGNSPGANAPAPAQSGLAQPLQVGTGQGNGPAATQPKDPESDKDSLKATTPPKNPKADDHSPPKEDPPPKDPGRSDPPRPLDGLGVGVFCLLVLGMLIFLMHKRGVYWDNFSYRLFGLVFIVSAGLFMVVVARNDERVITSVIALLGTALGYLLGKESPGSPASPGAPDISTVTLKETSVKGGKKVEGTVTLTANAPAGGIAVHLTSSNSESATLSSPTVTVPSGSRIGTFRIDTSEVNVDTVITINASFAGATSVAQLIITK